MDARQRRSDFIRLAGIGVLMTLGYALLAMSFGERTLTSREAWQLGVAQPYVIGGLALKALSWLWYRGASWTRWPLIIWAPVAILSCAVWAESRGVGVVDAMFVVVALFIGSLWIWGTFRILFPKRREDA